jgi:hypothetical protein
MKNIKKNQLSDATNHHDDALVDLILEDMWDHYSHLPSPKWYE